MTEQSLPGGVGNGGMVVRVGDTVRRPWRSSTRATHALLTHLDRVLPGVAPVPLGETGRDEQGREMLSWIDGDVGVPPFPGWVAEETFLVSLGELLRRVHDALDGWPAPADAVWAGDIVDPHGGPLIVHSDICVENVIVRDGRAVAIIDWEFAAPGRRIWDVVSTARLCVPFTAPSRRDPVYDGLDVTHRLRVLLDAYGLDDADRASFTEVLEERRVIGERFVRNRVARGEPAFTERWDNPDGEARFQVEHGWVAAVPKAVARKKATAQKEGRR
jgi:hypothetical protein